MTYDAPEELAFGGWPQPQFTRVLNRMSQQKLLPCRACGALVHTKQVVVAAYAAEDDRCPLCCWSEDIEGFMVPDVSHFQQRLRCWQKDLEHLEPYLDLIGASRNIGYDPEFRLIKKSDFLMSNENHQLTVDFGSDIETWFYWRSNYWHRNPKIIRKKSYVRKLKRIMQDPVRRKIEIPKVSPCARCGQALEWYVRRSHELGFKCPDCRIIYVIGSSLFEGEPLVDYGE